MKSWRTSLAGIANFVGVLAVQLSAQFDADPNTAPNWALVLSAGVVLFGFLSARDANVTSEQQGLK